MSQKKNLCHQKKILRKIIVMCKTGDDIAPFDGSTYLRVVSPPPFLARLASFFSRLALYSFSLARMKSSFLAFSVPNVFLRLIWKIQLKLTMAKKNWIPVLTFNRMFIVQDIPYICLLFTGVIWLRLCICTVPYLYTKERITAYKIAVPLDKKTKCCGSGIKYFFAVFRIRIQSGQWIRILFRQCFGSGSGLDPYSIGPLDPDPDQ